MNKEARNNFIETSLALMEKDRNFFKEEKAEFPNQFCFDKTRDLVVELNEINIIPDKIQTCIDSGITLTFKNLDQEMYAEIYNTEEYGYIIVNNKNKQMIENRDVYSIEEFIEKIKKFKGV